MSTLPPPRPPLPNPNPSLSLATTINGGTSTHKKCSSCEFSTRCPLFIHNVRFRGVLRRLCTSCVLRLHPSSFCPTCFDYYDSAPPHSSKRFTCSNCSSFTHTACASNASSNKPYLCRACSDPSFKFFDLEKAKSKLPPGDSIEKSDAVDRNRLVIDKDLASVLLCASKISSSSMHKAVLVARAEAERRIREAAGTRKRARDTLEQLFYVNDMWIKQNKKMIKQRVATNNATVTEIPETGVADGDTHMEENGGPAVEPAGKKDDVIADKDSGQQQNGDRGDVKMEEKNTAEEPK